MVDFTNRVEKTLNNYKTTLSDFQKKLEDPKKVTAAEVKAFLRTIRKEKIQHRTAVKQFIAKATANAKIAQNTADAIRSFLTNLATNKEVIETAAIHVLSQIEEELDEEEKFLQEEARTEYNTVGEIEKGAQDTHQ